MRAAGGAAQPGGPGGRPGAPAPPVSLPRIPAAARAPHTAHHLQQPGETSLITEPRTFYSLLWQYWDCFNPEFECLKNSPKILLQVCVSSTQFLF